MRHGTPLEITQCWQKTNSVLIIVVLLKGSQMADAQKIINLNVFYLIIIYFLEKLFQIKYIMYGILILSWPSANSA